MSTKENSKVEKRREERRGEERRREEKNNSAAEESSMTTLSLIGFSQDTDWTPRLIHDAYREGTLSGSTTMMGTDSEPQRLSVQPRIIHFKRVH